MLGLATVLLLRQATGSLAPAGATAAALLVGQAAGGIAQTRRIDRTRQTPMLVACGLLHPTAVGLLALGAARRAPPSLLAAAALLAGLSAPQLTSCTRVAWSELLDDELDRQAAFALDAVALEAIFLLGPALVGGIVLAASPTAAVPAAAALAAAGTLAFAASGPSRSWRGHAAPRALAGPLHAPAIRTVLLATLLFGIGDGFLQLAVTGYAVARQRPGMAGALLAAVALGSGVLGGACYGRRRWPGRPWQRFLVLHLLLAGGLALAVLGSGPAVLAAPLALSGLAIAPIATEGGILTSASAPQGTVTEAFAWSVTAVAAGIAAGTAAAGLLAAALGFRATVLAAAASCGLAAMVIALRRDWPAGAAPGQPR
jgi:hypothetical protein